MSSNHLSSLVSLARSLYGPGFFSTGTERNRYGQAVRFAKYRMVA